MAADMLNPFDGRDELISSLGKRSILTWRRRIVIGCRANLSNAEIEPAIDEGVDAPDCFTQFLSGHRLTGTEDEAREHLCGLRLQADLVERPPSKFSFGEGRIQKGRIEIVLNPAS